MTRSTPQTSQRRVLLGQITGVHGIRGDLIVRSYAAAPEDIAAYGPLTDTTGLRAFQLKVLRISDKGVVAHIAGIDDRTAAEALRGMKLFVERSRLPATQEAEYYHADLIGLIALDEAGVRQGTVVAIQNFGAGDLLELRADGQTATEFIPFTNACVPAIDLDLGTVTVVRPDMTGEPEPATPEGDD